MKLDNFLPKKLSLSSQKYGFGIRAEIRDPEKTYSGSQIQGSIRHRISDPWGQKGTGSRIRIRNTASEYKCLRYLSPGAPEIGYLAQHQLLDQVNRLKFWGRNEHE
jgi:hypothetical protein